MERNGDQDQRCCVLLLAGHDKDDAQRQSFIKDLRHMEKHLHKPQNVVEMIFFALTQTELEGCQCHSLTVTQPT